MHHPSCFAIRRLAPRLGGRALPRLRAPACCPPSWTASRTCCRALRCTLSSSGPYPGGCGGRCVGSGDRHWPVWRCCSPWGPQPVPAATITVGGPCTLAAAIRAANTDTARGGCPAGSGADTIVLPPGSTQLLTTVNNSTYGPTGLPVIPSVITIAGHGSTIVRASAAPEFRLFAVNSAGALTLNETTVSGEQLPFSERFPGYNGGGVANYGGTLIVRNSILYVNRAGEDAGLFSFRKRVATQG